MKRILLFIAMFISTIAFSQTIFEKGFFHLVNLVRTNPKLVSSLIQNESKWELSWIDQDSLKNVISILSKLPARDSLVFDTTMYNIMGDNHGQLCSMNRVSTTIEIGDNPSKKVRIDTITGVTHNYNFLRKYGYAEISSPYKDDPFVCLVTFLVDRGNWDEKSKTHKPHLDIIIGKYTKTAVRVNVTEIGTSHLFQDFE